LGGSKEKRGGGGVGTDEKKHLLKKRASNFIARPSQGKSEWGLLTNRKGKKGIGGTRGEWRRKDPKLGVS